MAYNPQKVFTIQSMKISPLEINPLYSITINISRNSDFKHHDSLVLECSHTRYTA